MPHFQVADVAASARSAIELGGNEIMHEKADDGRSQWAVLGDQFGAAFGIIPVVTGESDTANQNERFGRISWLSLTVPDAIASQAFYQHVVGWNPRPMKTENRDEHASRFEMQIDNDIEAAEICQHRSGFGEIPSVWLIHLPVDDLVESLRRVNEGGGEVIQEFAVESYAIVRDPVGVYLALQTGQ
jgi:hypothetical protein